ncbi:hypothetical protein ILUMI_22899, partial [Ignelater luminosus]
VDNSEINRIEVASRGQFRNPTAENERQNRLTASLFASVIKRKPHRPCHNIIKSCLKSNRSSIDATDYGVVKEKVAIALFEKKTTGSLGASTDGKFTHFSIITIISLEILRYRNAGCKILEVAALTTAI